MGMALDKSALLAGAAGGLLTGTVAWFLLRPIVNKQMEDELRTQLRQQIPAQLNASLDQKLRQYGFTPETGRQVARLLQLADQSGLI